MAVKFTREDLAVFHISGFQARMKALREKIQPKLKNLGEEVGPPLMSQFKREFYPHVAKHLRRTVNPPDETWLAMGPESRGYKAYPYLAFCIGAEGAQSRVVLKEESSFRKDLGANLLGNRPFFLKRAGDFKGLLDFSKRKAGKGPAPIEDFADFLQNMGDRLKNIKTAQLDIGLKVNPLSRTLDQEILRVWDVLFPFFQCGLGGKVRLS